MAWIRLTNKNNGGEEIINTDSIARIYTHKDKDPETMIQFNNGLLVPYIQPRGEVAERLRRVHTLWGVEELPDVGS